ncbi:hypothetical protein OIU34_21680 [Pararhizobium sp. BT-229]|uniref:hypothetical protein n=1 Tax=Pararhizobium sp. BT-229 TaxID=2986923 RepID=UPI0021F7A86C|nr:hypothetical protein [Pararhizobium sp. BT-229]MCV9964504.1 hypothetical protein [Pararhizobium sp. BT-229]
MNIRSALFAACVVVSASVATASGFAEDDTSYTARGVPATSPEEAARFVTYETSQEVRRIGREYERLLDEIAEREFRKWCAFNGFDGIATTGMRNTFTCLQVPGYRAVRIDGTVRLFKQDEDRMVRLETFVTRASDRYKLVDFAAVRRAFALRDQ